MTLEHSTSPAFSVIFEHEDFWVLNKAAGIDFHTQEDSPGLLSFVRDTLALQTLFPVHRLDKDTSGLILLAKHQEAARAFGVLFESHTIQKYYLALSDQKTKKKQGWVKGDMQKSRNGCWKLMATQMNPAITYFVSSSIQPSLRVFLLKPYSGRTHQLRVAMKSLASPILGDHRYGTGLADRMYLHAYAVMFKWKNQHLRFTSLPVASEGVKWGMLTQSLVDDLEKKCLD